MTTRSKQKPRCLKPDKTKNSHFKTSLPPDTNSPVIRFLASAKPRACRRTRTESRANGHASKARARSMNAAKRQFIISFLGSYLSYRCSLAPTEKKHFVLNINNSTTYCHGGVVLQTKKNIICDFVNKIIKKNLSENIYKYE